MALDEAIISRERLTSIGSCTAKRSMVQEAAATVFLSNYYEAAMA